MARHPWPPHDYVCLYEHTCPYLDGLSTKWVLGQYRHADEVYHEHLRIIDNYREAVQDRDGQIKALERKLAETQAKYQALHRKQFKPNRKQAETANGSSSTSTKPKKRGAPVGHPAWTRPVPTRIDRIVPVPSPSACPHCGSHDLTPEGTLHEHIQEDIVVKPQTVVTKYVHEEAFCPRCNRTVVGAGPDEIPNAPIGPLAKSTAGYLRYDIGIPYRKVQRIFEDLFGMTCAPASLAGFDNRAAKRGEPIYEDVRDKVTHLKARCQGKISTPWRENEIFSPMVVVVIDYFTIAAISVGLRYQSLLYQSPIRIKVIGGASKRSMTLSPLGGDQKIFGSLPCP